MTTSHSPSSAASERALLATLVHDAMRFALWAAGEGICPVDGQPARSPEDFFYEYSCAADVEDWEGLAEVARDAVMNGVAQPTLRCFDCGRPTICHDCDPTSAQPPAAPVDIPDDVRATEDMTLAMNARQAAINEMMAAPVETTSAPEYDDKCEYYPYFEMLWKWFEERRGKEDMRANAIDGLSVADFKSMLDEHEAELTAPPSSSADTDDDELIGLNARLSDALKEIAEWKQAASAEAGLRREFHQHKLALWEAAAGGPEPRCRDCADFNGRCQGEGLPCDPQERALERIKHLRAVPQPAPVLPADAIDSRPHPYRPASTELERKSLLWRVELEGEAAISNILFQSALALPGEGSFAGMLWTIGEWIATRHPSSPLSRPHSPGETK